MSNQRLVTSGVGRAHGTSRKAPFDRWFRYPAGFPSDYAAALLTETGITEGTVVDCFGGSGVAGSASKQLGLSFVGIEAHPLMAQLAELKLNPKSGPEDVQASVKAVVERAKLADGRRDEGEEHALIQAETELVRKSFSPAVLCSLISLREEISRLHDPSRDYLLWALLGTLRDVARVKVGWPYQRPSQTRQAPHTQVLERFAVRASWMVEDLKSEAVNDSGWFATIRQGDSRLPETWQGLPEMHASVSSPPYLNNFDYADATRLELYFLGEVRTWAEMCAAVRTDMLTATTQQSSVREKKDAVSSLSLSFGVSVEIASVTARLQQERAARTRGKEYDQVVPAYFAGMSSVLQNLATTLKSGAVCSWLVGDSAPYGVHVDTPRLIGEMASELGFEFKEDVALRARGARWKGAPQRHGVELSERLIVFVKT